MFWIEATAVVFGLLAVWFVVRQNIWCWPTGLVQVSLYVFIFFQVKLYSDVILHLIYVVLQIYGWVHWLYGGEDRGELPVSRLAGRSFIGWILVAGVGTGAWGAVMARTTDAAVPYGDAFTTAASLIAMWLMARKHIENWHFWIAVDVIAIGIYLYKDLYLTSGLYVAFLILSIAGLIAWRRSLEDQAVPGPALDRG
jgi:nicotinamide mononucleotide transporter